MILTAVESVVNEDGKVLLVRRIDTDGWAVPGGILEPGEFAGRGSRSVLVARTHQGLLGGGVRLFDVLLAPIELEIVRVIDTPQATHLRYRIRH